MRCLLQRVKHAKVTVGANIVGQIGEGLLIFVCAMDGDTEQTVSAAAKRCASLRIFADESGKMNKSLVDIDGEALVVSQFTLAANSAKGNRPSFSEAASPNDGKRLYDLFCDKVREFDINVQTGEFGADMQVELTNDGPVTIWLDIG